MEAMKILNGTDTTAAATQEQRVTPPGLLALCVRPGDLINFYLEHDGGSDNCEVESVGGAGVQLVNREEGNANGFISWADISIPAVKLADRSPAPALAELVRVGDIVSTWNEQDGGGAVGVEVVGVEDKGVRIEGSDAPFIPWRELRLHGETLEERFGSIEPEPPAQIIGADPFYVAAREIQQVLGRVEDVLSVDFDGGTLELDPVVMRREIGTIEEARLIMRKALLRMSESASRYL